ncbi:MAG: carotenoid 1,2-hydratase [Pseudomonadota bacterium]
MGSVFSPYYAWAGRKDPDDHVCINVALYSPKGARWAMTERGHEQLTRDAQLFQVGPSDLSWSDEDGLTLNFDEVSIPYPPNDFLPSRLRGTVKLKPHFVTDTVFELDDKERHRWWPIAPSSRIEVKFDGPQKSNWPQPDWAGEGYLDCNWGMEPIEDAFAYWNWARGESADGTTTLIYDTYLKSGRNDMLALSYGHKGELSHFDPPAKSSLGKGFWGVQRLGHHDAGHRPKLVRSYEDGPFYTRNVVDTHLNGAPVRMMHESLSGDRIGQQWVKLLLPWRMPRRARF